MLENCEPEVNQELTDAAFRKSDALLELHSIMLLFGETSDGKVPTDVCEDETHRGCSGPRDKLRASPCLSLRGGLGLGELKHGALAEASIVG